MHMPPSLRAALLATAISAVIFAHFPGERPDRVHAQLPGVYKTSKAGSSVSSIHGMGFSPQSARRRTASPGTVKGPQGTASVTARHLATARSKASGREQSYPARCTRIRGSISRDKVDSGAGLDTLSAEFL